MMDPAHETSEVNPIELKEGAVHSVEVATDVEEDIQRKGTERHVIFVNVLFLKTVSKHPAI